MRLQHIRLSNGIGSFWGLVILGSLGFSHPIQAQEAPKEDGLFITVANPITDRAVEQIKAAIEKNRSQDGKNLKKIVFDFNPDGKEANTKSYGSPYSLAQYIRQLSLNGITTIGFVHGKTTGHTVLPALACTDLVMSREAKIGEVVEVNAPLPPKSEIEFYSELAGPRAAIVLKMLDKDVQVMSGMQNQSTIYLDGRKANDPQYANVFAKQLVPDLSPGKVELYTADKALKFGLCKLIRDTRQEVAEQYQLPPSSMREDVGGRAPKACKIDVVGTIDTALKEKIRRQVEEAVAKRENVIFLVLDCAGGDPKVAREMADDLRNLKDPDQLPIRTVAYVPSKAPDLATFIAFGCSEIIMFKGSEPDNEATLGDFEIYLADLAKNPDANINPEFIKRNLREVAEAQGYPTLLVDAMLEKDMTLVRARNQKTGERKLMTKAMAEQDRDFKIETVIKDRGFLLNLKASQARDLRVAHAVVDNKDIKDVYAANGFDPKDVREAKPHWLDSLAAFLRRTEVSILLVLIGIGGLILELKVPGMTVPGIIAAICFVLFFWSQSQLSGEIVYLAILLFILGLILIGIEIFVLPGFGVTGVSGILLVIVGLGLATVDKLPQSSEDWVQFAGKLIQYGLTIVASTSLALMFARYLPKIPYANRYILVPPSEKPEENEATLPGAELAASLLGKTGTATSMLRPAGMARFGDIFVDVVTEGGFIEPGTAVQVIEVEGTRIVVKAV